jgi:hypothetical protein
MPAEGTEALENLAFDLAQEASELSGQLHPIVRLSVAELVRSMNCYYSNLIEGHNTHPRDIDRALSEDYSTDPRKRDLQLEARAHIEVQRLIDARADFPKPSGPIESSVRACLRACSRSRIPIRVSGCRSYRVNCASAELRWDGTCHHREKIFPHSWIALNRLMRRRDSQSRGKRSPSRRLTTGSCGSIRFSMATVASRA